MKDYRYITRLQNEVIAKISKLTIEIEKKSKWLLSITMWPMTGSVYSAEDRK